MPAADKNSNNIAFVEDGGLERLLKRLKKGMILPTRIVYCLGDGKYLLRVYGHNLVMQSGIRFERFDEIQIEIRQVTPRLIVQLVDPARAGRKNTGRMDITV